MLYKSIFRALFDHDAIRDDDCPSYGLSFKHGDVLHILNGSDEEWWQAALVGSYADDGPQGLIPSKKRYTIFINLRACTRGKAIGFVRLSVSTKIARSRSGDLGVIVKCKYHYSVVKVEKLPFFSLLDA